MQKTELKNLHFSMRYLQNTKRRNSHRITLRGRKVTSLWQRALKCNSSNPQKNQDQDQFGYWCFSKGSYPVFMKGSKKTTENSERLGRQGQPGWEHRISWLTVFRADPYSFSEAPPRNGTEIDSFRLIS